MKRVLAACLALISSFLAEGFAAGAVVDTTYTSEGQLVKAYVVRPTQGKGPFAAVLFVHWLGDPETSNRTQFLPEALELAERGVISVLIEAPWSDPKWYSNRIPEEDYANSLRQVMAQRRAMDLLLTQPDVDRRRVAVVAHDFGAMYAILAEASDKRAKTYIFMAPAPHFIDWFLFARQPKDPSQYKATLAPLDPVNLVGQLSHAPILFQFAANDHYVSPQQAAAFSAATRGPKEVRTYPTEHHLRVPEARADRTAWLVRELGL